LNRTELSLLTNRRPRWAVEFGWFCHGKPWNFANWSTEFGKIFSGKMWTLLMSWANGLVVSMHRKNAFSNTRIT